MKICDWCTSDKDVESISLEWILDKFKSFGTENINYQHFRGDLCKVCRETIRNEINSLIIKVRERRNE